MKFRETSIQGLLLIDLINFKDDRGNFVKTFHEDTFREEGLELNYRESFYSTSKKGVIRGMHFQVPPHDHAKIVYAVYGDILDVLVDMRKDSETFGKFESIELTAEDPKAVYIPKGMAHGFTSLSQDAILVYNVSTVHNKESDIGIRYDSFGFDWQVDDEVLSERDLSFPALQDFNSPF